jgi:cytochrome c oxidase subunit IV
MGHSYEESKKVATKIITILAIVTIVEVFVALLGKGYLVHGFHLPHWLIAILMIAGSAYKAYLIIYEFMHMKYEVPGLVKTVLLPTLLLVWAIIAFASEGNFWLHSRKAIDTKEIEGRLNVGSPEIKK